MTFRELEEGQLQLQRRISELQKGDPAGRMEPYAGATPPSGWLLCDGAAVARADYPELFAAIGTTYGAGNGSTTFNLPNAAGRTLVGRDAAQSEFNTLGETGGAKTHTLTVAQMPSHIHTTRTPRFLAADVTSGGGMYSPPLSPTAPGLFRESTPTGGDEPHNNLQPYLTVNYIIRAR